MAIDYTAKQKEVERQIHALQKEKRRLSQKEKSAKRKHEDHIKILVGATFLTHYSEDKRNKIYNEMSDEEIVDWVNSRFKG